jgi:hypothetical protein
MKKKHDVNDNIFSLTIFQELGTLFEEKGYGLDKFPMIPYLKS